MIWGYILLLAAVFVISNLYHYKKYDKRFYEYQNKTTALQFEEVRQLYDTMRGWRHDYHNHMQKIRAHLALMEYDAVEDYIDLMENELGTINIKYKTGNTGVDAMLNSKLALAESKGIKIKCDAVLPKELGLNPVDLCVLLGNLIDNAIEACEQIQDADGQFIRIYLCVQKKQFYISVCNATKELVRKLDKEYITNKRGNHGNGLKRIDKVVEKHKGYINRQNEPGVFATEIMLPLP